jgi:acyl-CoA reductase-like NAD-dependent aldehyde dehydrogenase
VVVAITPFNHPLNRVALKFEPGIATHSRVALKRSAKVWLSAFSLLTAIHVKSWMSCLHLLWQRW